MHVAANRILKKHQASGPCSPAASAKLDSAVAAGDICPGKCGLDTVICSMLFHALIQPDQLYEAP